MKKREFYHKITAALRAVLLQQTKKQERKTQQWQRPSYAITPTSK